ncbi:MAG: glycosyltransferase family 4 protein [Bacteroidales bacterium]|jgi:glycosyltransferase involved in cell wall biosynthesis|nr:glycosyltransferase family 4 protein [Bacteroidales bacterium]
MKVLLLSPLPPPHGGIAGWTLTILEHYRNNRFDYEIIHQDTAVRTRRVTNSSLLHRIISGIRITGRIYSSLRKRILKEKPDVIHITSSASIALLKDLLLLHLVRKHNVSVIIHFRFGRIPDLRRAKNWEWYLLRKVMRQSKVSIVIDRISYNSLMGSGFKNIAYIPNPVSPNIEKAAISIKLNPVPKRIGKVVFIGHIIPKKGVFELVNSSVAIPEIEELILIGPFEKSIKQKLLTLAKKRTQASWITFTGSLERNEIIYQLKDTSILVLPSYTEGFPNVIIEAMAMGCAVIATNVGAIPEMLNIDSNNPCGICIRPKDSDDLKKAFSYLLADYDRVAAMGKNGVERVLSSYSMSTISREYERIWQNAIGLESNKKLHNHNQNNVTNYQ